MLVEFVMGEGDMRILGLDVGDRRTGVAISDRQGMLATPLMVVDARDEDSLIDAILKLVEQHDVERIVVGLPRLLDGQLGEQADKVTVFVDRLRLRAEERGTGPLDIHLWDERLSTQAAERLSSGPGAKGRRVRSRAKRGAKEYGFRAKAEVDAIAAAFILQGYLDSLPGEEQCLDV